MDLSPEFINMRKHFQAVNKIIIQTCTFSEVFASFESGRQKQSNFQVDFWKVFGDFLPRIVEVSPRRLR
jgi:hypothetical protein